MSGFSAVFLDRDGTLNVKAPEGLYVTRPQDLVLIDGAAAEVRRLNESGLRTVLVTNQRCVALGLLSSDDLDQVTAALGRLLADGGAHLDAVYVCPHGLGECSCRKPAPGLFLRAAADLGIDLSTSAMIGDAETDCEAARRAGVVPVLIGRQRAASAAEFVARDLAEAVDWILEH